MLGKRASAATRISLGLVGLTVTLLLVAQLVGLVPDRSEAILKGRKALCEAVAFHWAIAAQTSDLSWIRAAGDSVVKRNPDVLSIALRSDDGKLLVEAGEHEAFWEELPTGESTVNQAVVPIFGLPGRTPRGQIEVRFASLDGGGLLSWLRIPIFGMVLFLAVWGFLVFRVYMGRTLQHLDPSKVVPERVKVALNIMSEGVALLDDRERIVLANDVFAATLGVPASELQGQRIGGLSWRQQDSGKPPEEYPWTEALREGKTLRGVALVLPDGPKGVRTFVVNVTPILGAGKTPKGALATFDDVSAVEEKNARLREMLKLLKESQKKVNCQNQQLQELAAHDPLTGCLNRRAFFENAEIAWSAAKRYGYPLGCIMVDVDHFKAVNDRHGHAVGDHVLRDLARRLQLGSRDSDVICRYGGEEFCILLLHADIEQTLKAAEHYRKSIESKDHAGIPVTVSLGCSATESGATDLHELLNQADQALYVAKRSGRKCSARWDDVAQEVKIEKTSPLSEELPGDAKLAVPIPIQAVNALMAALAHRDITTAEHSREVAELCVTTAEGLMSPSECFVLEVAALLHDIGKLSVPDWVLLKPGPLTEEEWRVMHHYNEMGVGIIASAFASAQLTEIARYHRAWYGGRPDKPAMPTGKDIPLRARILAIGDAFSAMTGNRPYRKAMRQEEAFEELRRCSDTQFDRELVELFIEKVPARDQSRRTSETAFSEGTLLEIGRQTEGLVSALEAQDISTLAVLAGRLAAVATKQGMPTIAQRAAQLQEAARGDGDPETILQLTTDLLNLSRLERENHLAAKRSS